MAFIITAEHLKKIAGRSTPLMPALAEWINKICPTYEIDTPQEYAHFLRRLVMKPLPFLPCVNWGPHPILKSMMAGLIWGIKFRGMD
ncbi:MAG TPA: hypothetical protein PLP34_06745 [Chitinophagaceae bacterium]|nr:hypothetical protein [Chitinophagaceae bacterium]